jgi:hypothetical protein
VEVVVGPGGPGRPVLDCWPNGGVVLVVESVFSPPGWPGLKDALEVVLLLRESDISVCPPPELPPNGGSGP